MHPLDRIPVLKRLYPSLRRRWARWTWTGGYRLHRYRGLLLMLHHGNYIDRRIAFYGDFEPAQQAFLLERVAAGCDAFLDIGANFGLYALQVARAEPAAEVHAFEPDPRNYGHLLAHLWLNGLAGRVQTHAVAVSDTAGELPFRLYPQASTGQTRVSADAGGANARLPAIALDDLFDWHGRRVAIKMDIEGHEPMALRGATRLLRENRCILQVESFPGHVGQVNGLLGDLGYREIHRLGDDHYYARD